MTEKLAMAAGGAPSAAGVRKRIRLAALQPRKGASGQEELRRVLESLGGAEGAPCRANCDCAIGLICRDNQCERDW